MWEAKLIISVSFGTTALFKWKAKSCPDGETSLCCLDHGAILVMDGQCQDEFFHCTDPGLEQERINVTFRWIRQHTASCPLRTGLVCCLPTCAQGSSAAVTKIVGYGVFLALLGVLCMWGGAGFAGLSPSYLQDSHYGGVPVAEHALWAEVGGGIICVTLGELTGLHKSVPHVITVLEVIPLLRCYKCLPWRDCPVSMVIMHVWNLWVKGAFRINCREFFS